MQLLDFLLKAIEYSVYGYFAISSLYVFVFSVAGNFYKRRRREASITKNKIATQLVEIPIEIRWRTSTVEGPRQALGHPN